MLNKEEIEEIKKGLREQLDSVIIANECGLSTNDFSESIKDLEGALKYIEQLENKLKELLAKYKKEYNKINNMQTNSVNVSVLQELKCIIEDLESIIKT